MGEQNGPFEPPSLAIWDEYVKEASETLAKSHILDALIYGVSAGTVAVDDRGQPEFHRVDPRSLYTSVEGRSGKVRGWLIGESRGETAESEESADRNQAGFRACGQA